MNSKGARHVLVFSPPSVLINISVRPLAAVQNANRSEAGERQSRRKQPCLLLIDVLWGCNTRSFSLMRIKCYICLSRGFSLPVLMGTSCGGCLEKQRRLVRKFAEM